MFLGFCTIVLFLLVIFLFRDSRKPKGYPPGPPWLPLIGNYMLFRKMLTKFEYHHLVWERFTQFYGNVVGLRLGKNNIVLVSGRAAIRDVLTREEFDGRPDEFFFRFRTFGKRLGIVFTDGELWQVQRKFSLKHLRNFGYGRRDMEDQISQEAKDLVNTFEKKLETPVLMHNSFDIAVLNILWAMLAGERYSLDDKRLVELLQIVHDVFRMIDMSGGLLNQMPFLRIIAPERSGFNKHVEIHKRMWAFLETTIDEHYTRLTAGSARDLIDAFLQNMVENKTTKTTFTREQLLALCLDLFMAGSETTSNTLSFAILYMIRHPNIQTRVQEEIDKVVGRNRWPTLQDRTKMNYVEAVLMEVQRLLNIAPVAVPHRATIDTNLMGFSIPKNTTILVCLRSLHMDEQYWGDPDIFRPDRFLDDSRNLILEHDDWFAPFGFGHRRCLGEGLARSSLFLFFTYIFHSFTLEASPNHPLPFPEGFDGVTISPKPFYAIIKRRFQ